MLRQMHSTAYVHLTHREDAVAEVSPLRRLRLARGWTMERVADGLGVDHATVSRMERGGFAPNGRVAAALDLLEATADERAAVWSWVGVPEQDLAGVA